MLNWETTSIAMREEGGREERGEICWMGRVQEEERCVYSMYRNTKKNEKKKSGGVLR